MTVTDHAWSVGAWTVRFRVSAASHTGMVRSLNEDSFVAMPPVFLVADGMGGHAHGDRASQATARVFEARLVGRSPARPADVLAAVREANELVRAIGTDDEVAGTTLAFVVLVQDDEGDPYWMACNVGDSRIYHWTDDGLLQLSIDHSAVQELLDLGEISPEQAADHPERNVVTRAIGVDGELGPDVWLLPAAGPALFLVCSDGLTKELDDDAIAEIVGAGAGADTGAVEPIAEHLVAAALGSGGSDNVTAVVVEAVMFPADVERRVSIGGVPQQLEETLPRTGSPA